MHALIVLAHPQSRSFNAQMKDVALETLGGAGWTTEVSDLYAMRFDCLEGPRHYTDMKEPEWLSAQTEQRHAHDTGTTGADVRAEIDKLEPAEP